MPLFVHKPVLHPGLQVKDSTIKLTRDFAIAVASQTPNEHKGNTAAKPKCKSQGAGKPKAKSQEHECTEAGTGKAKAKSQERECTAAGAGKPNTKSLYKRQKPSTQARSRRSSSSNRPWSKTTQHTRVASRHARNDFPAGLNPPASEIDYMGMPRFNAIYIYIHTPQLRSGPPARKVHPQPARGPPARKVRGPKEGRC